MNLRQLKKQLKQQQRQMETKNRSRRWIWLLLLLLVAAAAIPIYQQREINAPQRLFEAAIKQESLGEIEAAQQLYQQLPYRPLSTADNHLH